MAGTGGSAGGEGFGKLFIELDANREYLDIGGSRVYFEPPKRHGKRRPVPRPIRYRVEAIRSVPIKKHLQ